VRDIAGRVASDRVELVETDLDQPRTLERAAAGVDVLFHVAGAYALCEPQRDEELQRVAVDGMAAMLRAAGAAGVRKVVLTSSVLCVPLTTPGAPPSTEADWNHDGRLPYARAKTAGERLAIELAGQLGLPLVTVLPGSIGGPGFGRATPTIDLLDTMRRGGFRVAVPRANLPYVDVRDVARAHRLAGESAFDGRFIIANDEQPDFRTLIEQMHAIDASVPLPQTTLPDLLIGLAPWFDRLNARTLGTPRCAPPEMIAMTRGKRFNVSSRRAAELLGWRPQVSLAQSLRDTLAALRERDAAALQPGLQAATSNSSRSSNAARNGASSKS
jgi:dihydroflavonol-4-reductase